MYRWQLDCTASHQRVQSTGRDVLVLRAVVVFRRLALGFAGPPPAFRGRYPCPAGERPNRVLTGDQLLEFTRSHMPAAFERSIDNQVSRLRRHVFVSNPRANPGIRSSRLARDQPIVMGL
jgi:hypothetical protein